MKKFEYTILTKKSVEEAISAIEQKVTENNFRVLHIHDISTMLTEKGFPRSPLKIIEICNTKYASQVLERDVKISLMLPCPISVYVENDKTYISTLLPSWMADFFPDPQIKMVALEVEKQVLKIINEACI